MRANKGVVALEALYGVLVKRGLAGRHLSALRVGDHVFRTA